ncbi:MAG: AAA family ATPase, partial [Syntrophaceae bacterium]|nr:AAA family ATPase [Syntrophaceae bacterium]
GKIACSILTSMDGMAENQHCVRIFTTNEKIDALDDAFVRPGRIDRRFTFDKPDSKLRRQLLAVWPEEIVEGIGGEEGCRILVHRSKNFSFAEMEAIRANLVTNFLFGDHTWNLDKAFEDFKEGAGSFRPVSLLGFGKSDGDESPEVAVPAAKY